MSKTLLWHKLKASCDVLATAKNVSFTSFGGIASNFNQGILRCLEQDLQTRCLIPAPSPKFETENIFVRNVNLNLRYPEDWKRYQKSAL